MIVSVLPVRIGHRSRSVSPAWVEAVVVTILSAGIGFVGGLIAVTGVSPVRIVFGFAFAHRDGGSRWERRDLSACVGQDVTGPLLGEEGVGVPLLGEKGRDLATPG